MTLEEYLSRYQMNRNRKWTELDTTIHEAAAHREDLKCPRCTAVGTYKAHGTISRNGGGHRRWLCKYCGYYFGSPAKDPAAEGEYQCRPHIPSGAWSGEGEGSGATPIELVWPVWPWR